MIASSLSSVFTPQLPNRVTESSPPVPLQAPKVLKMEPLPATQMPEISNVADVPAPKPKPVATYTAPAPKPPVAPVRAPQPQIASGGNCASWIAAAGISDSYSAMALINRESGCNPYITNASSGSCGVAQELPCGKSGCVLGDGYCQVAWMNRYVLSVYGSWGAALGHSYAFNWY